ncbi:MAG: peptidoglycan DD-metalloendopeptidase family protein [Chloroflexi bacterium]|nr:peptidoglycan DD-metalloendopeptidase family protein [Chloroflexota bacterium]
MVALSLTLVVFATLNRVQASATADIFSPPLGYHDGLQYAPRITYDNSHNLIENTNYGVKNPDLQGLKCFGVDWSQLYHAGEDLYRTDGSSTRGAEVTAVANGTVMFADPLIDWPGRVVIVKHVLTNGQTIYSVYGHIENLAVVAAQTLARGDKIGTVLYQAYTGRYSQYHPSGDDSHLHFEIRYFYDGSNIYPAPYTTCNKPDNVPGVGYTYPGIPDNFPAPGAGYTNPSAFIRAHAGTFLPAIGRCPGNSYEYLVNGNFESGSAVGWAQYSSGGYQLIPYLPGYTHSGDYFAFLGAFNNLSENISQTTTLPADAASINYSYWWQMTTQEYPSADYDYLRVQIQTLDGLGNVITTGDLYTVTNRSTAGQWVFQSHDLSAYSGWTIRLIFSDTTDGSAPTNFYVDDVSLPICGLSGPPYSAGTPPAGTPTPFRPAKTPIALTPPANPVPKTPPPPNIAHPAYP